MVAGGIAGVLSWIISFPLDVIKSRMQAGNVFYFYSKYILIVLLWCYYTSVFPNVTYAFGIIFRT